MENMEKYKVEHEIGKGSFGVVYKAKRRADEVLVAIKKVEKVRCFSLTIIMVLSYLIHLILS